MTDDSILKAYARGYAAGQKKLAREQGVMLEPDVVRHDKFFQAALQGILANNEKWYREVNKKRVYDTTPEGYVNTAKTIADAAMKIARR